MRSVKRSFRRKVCGVLALVLGAALLLWGCEALYNWATTGQEVLGLYGDVESVARLVREALTSAIVRLALGAGAVLGGVLALRRRRPPQSQERQE